VSAVPAWLPCTLFALGLLGAALAARAAHLRRVRELEALARGLDRGVAITTPDPVAGVAGCRVEGRLAGRDVRAGFDWLAQTTERYAVVLDAELARPRPGPEIESILRECDPPVALEGRALRTTLQVPDVRAAELRRGLERLVAIAARCDRAAPVRLGEAARGLRCPWCKDGLDASAALACPRCATAHHAECFGESGCTVLGCRAADAPRAGRDRTA
jgi:HAMP domain-containing protein